MLSRKAAVARLHAWLGRLSLALKRFGALFLLPLMTLVITFDVVMRYVFNAPLSWGLEAASWLLILVFISGMIEGFRRNAHVQMDLVHRRLPVAARKAVGVVYVGLVIIVFGLLIKKMVAEIPFLYSLPEVSQYLGLPKWIFFAAIVAVSGLVIAYFLLCLVEIVLSRRVDVGEDANEQGEYPN